MSDSEAVLTADRLYRFYRAGDEETLALRGVSFEVEPGQVVVVVGPSGSGKSTLLSCVTGLDEPSGGTVWLGSQRMSHRPDAQRARLRAEAIGVMGQERNLVAHLSVAGNVRLSQRLAGRRASTDDVLEAVGIRHRQDAYPHELSGGETARAGLAVALANHPRMLVADEPTGELDEATEQRILALFKERAGAGAGVLIASHSPAVRRAADHVLSLTDGVLTP